MKPLWILLVLAVATGAMGNEAKTEAMRDEDAPKRQMLFTIFRPIMHDIGSRNTEKAKLVSGPVEMKMANNKKPGKQWRVRLAHSTFKVTIEDAAGLTLTNALRCAERIPATYLRALEVVSEDKKAGLAFYKTLGGAAAHGGQSYLNMIPLKPARAASVIVHEAGHILEQRARNTDEDILDQWAEAVKKDNIDVSHYGNHANHEDQADFARIYAFCSDQALRPNRLAALRELSPARFDLWEKMLALSGARQADAPATPCECSEPWKKRIQQLDDNLDSAMAVSTSLDKGY
jgi:hypothetical protein